jgi:hypothetical protein
LAAAGRQGAVRVMHVLINPSIKWKTIRMPNFTEYAFSEPVVPNWTVIV